MDYRPVQPSDVDAVAAFAIEGLRPDLYPGHLDRSKVLRTIRHFCDGNGWNLVAFDGARVVGVAAALEQEQFWFERREAIVVCLFATVPGVGWRLFRAMRRWFDADPMLRALRWPFEFDADPKQLRVAERFGCNSFHVTASRYKF